MKRFIISLGFLLISIILYAQVTFRPAKATITDRQGSFSSTSFNYSNIKVDDRVNRVVVYFLGETITMSSENNNTGVYTAYQTKNGTTIKFTAYRSSLTKQIYLVVMTFTDNDNRLDVSFKP